MVDVAQWLADLGLSQYRDAFEEHAIDAQILKKLNDDDLKELGVKALGHRKRLLEGIVALSMPNDAFLLHNQSKNRSARDAERRQLTLLFCDLVGSTELAAKLDPEDLAIIMRAYRDVCQDQIDRWSGHVVKFLGDGVLAYFGFPIAHEDDAERAVRAGLDLVREVAKLSTGDGRYLSARIGIATGLVIVGELIGEGASLEEAVIGETPNLAARLQALAQPGNIAISPLTRDLINGLFELESQGAHNLKGFANPTEAWRVVDSKAGVSRFAARAGRGLTPLVGRDRELALFDDLWLQAAASQGQMLLISGEPGIGKSRLSQTMKERAGSQGRTSLTLQCSPFHMSSALHPVIELLKQRADLQKDDVEDAKLDKIERLLSQALPEDCQLPFLMASLLSLPTARYPDSNLSAQRQKEKTLTALRDYLEAMAQMNPVLFTVEDVHWIDPTSLELVDHLIERLGTLPMLMILTYRPEFRPSWLGQSNVHTLYLNRLPKSQSAAVVAGVTGGKGLPGDILEQILGKTDGVPLFLEELTKTVLESDFIVDAGDHYAIRGDLPPLAIPASLHDSLAARLDRFSHVKEVAQIGASIGREFPHALIASLTSSSDIDLTEALEALLDAGLIFKRGTAPEATYVFKHALVQDAAYQSLLKSKRQQLHDRIAVVLEEQFSETVELRPDLLAHHFAAAGLNDQAIAYYLKAGQRAVLQATHEEAINLTTKGLKLLDAQPDTPGRDQRELALQITLGPALMAARGFGTPEVKQAYKRASELCEDLNLYESPEYLRTLYGLRRVYHHRGKLDKSLAVSKKSLDLASKLNDKPLLLDAHYSVGASFLMRGELASAEAHLDKGSHLGDDPAYGEATFGTMDVKLGPICQALMAWLLWARGFPNQAQLMSLESLTRAQEQEHHFTEAHVLFQYLMTCSFRREVSATCKQAESTISIAREYGFPLWVAWAKCLHGWSLVEQGREAEGIRQMRQGLAASSDIGTAANRPYFLSLLATALGRFGKISDGLLIVTEALDLTNETGECFWGSEVHRCKGNLLLSPSLNKQAEAEACFARALSIARHQQSKSWELRAAIPLSRLWAGRGERQKAHDLLAQVYGWFTEGFDTADLKDAKVLINELRAGISGERD